jgi:hypothetical protein
MLQCPHCRNAVDDARDLAGQLVFCPFCRGQFQMPAPLAIVSTAGAAPHHATDRVLRPLNSPGLAAVLSFFYCGLGQIYNGDFAKGLLFLLLYSTCYAASVASVWIPLIPAYPKFSAFFVLVPLGLMIWLYGMLDAFVGADKYNHRRR